MLFSRLAVALTASALASAHIVGISASTKSSKSHGRYARTFGASKSNFYLTFMTESADNTTDFSVVVGLSNSTSSDMKRDDSSSSIGTPVDVIDLVSIGKSNTSGKNFTVTVPIPKHLGKRHHSDDSNASNSTLYYTVTAAVTTASGTDGQLALQFYTASLNATS